MVQIEPIRFLTGVYKKLRSKNCGPLKSSRKLAKIFKFLTYQNIWEIVDYWRLKIWLIPRTWCYYSGWWYSYLLTSNLKTQRRDIRYCRLPRGLTRRGTCHKFLVKPKELPHTNCNWIPRKLNSCGSTLISTWKNSIFRHLGWLMIHSSILVILGFNLCFVNSLWLVSRFSILVPFS